MKRLVAVVVIVASACLIVAAPTDARVVVGTRIWIGPGWGPYWGPGWYPPYYYPPAYVYPPPYAPAYPVPIETEPQSYIQRVPVPPAPVEQAPASSYWYYCEGAKAYYPYVKECPGGWLTVVPPAAPESPR
jgi:hypothetical protein